MVEQCLPEAIDRHAGQGQGGHRHVRNVVGTVPTSPAVLRDAGAVAMLRALRRYQEHGEAGVRIPNYTPALACVVPRHVGIAWALGGMRAAITLIERECAVAASLRWSLPTIGGGGTYRFANRRRALSCSGK